MDVELRKRDVLIMVRKMMSDSSTVFAIVLQYFINHRRLTSNESRPSIREHYSLKHKIPKQVEHLHEIIAVDDVTCINNLRMSRDAFVRLCYLLQHSGGLQANRNVSIHEQVAMFLAILGHHTKNRIVKHNYKRSGRIVSKNFHAVLNYVIRLHPVLLAQPEPVTEDCSNDRWKWFKGNMEGANSSKVSTKNQKTDNRRRIWNFQEEEALINALKDLVVSGWKCENGFRTGYLICLEKELLKAFPGSDLRAEPHVNSKMHVWKKCYSSLSFMLGRRGFGWNDETKMFTVENESIWKEHVKIDPFARTMRYKTWPHYHHWCEIFGKDRATGENAEDFSSADKDQLDVNNVEFEGNMNDVMPEEENDFVSVCQPASSSTEKKSKSKRKRSIDSIGEKLVELMGAFCEETKSGLSDLTKKMGVDYDLQTQRKSVYEALGVIEHLFVADKVYVAKKLVNNSKELDLFFSLPDEAKIEMVRQLIHDDI
ncbi:hypothetical protein C2S52_008758 [Perilla frutescens var. hirtella]|nr:hypothetical protein C2S52_008758 [Perilla frutescens var. hirtella]